MSHRKLFVRCACLWLMATGTSVSALPASASSALADYLRAMISRSAEVRSAEARLPYNLARWDNARAWYIPDSELAIDLSGSERSAHDQSSDSQTRELEWRSSVSLPIGSQLSLTAVSRYESEQSTLSGTKLPDVVSHNESLTAGVVQPLLHRWRRSVTGARERRERARYQQQHAAVRQARQNALKQAIERLVERAFQSDALALERDLLGHRRKLRSVAESAFTTGAITASERDQAVHDWLRQLSRYRNTRRSLREAQSRVASSGPSHRSTVVAPAFSLGRMADILEPLASEAQAILPPAVLVSRHQVAADRADVEATRYAHWPELELFAEYGKQWTDPEPDGSSTTLGVRFRYQFFPVASREQQLENEARLAASLQQHRAEAVNWERSLRRARGTLDRVRLRQAELERHLSRQRKRYQRTRLSHRTGEESLAAVLQTLTVLADTEREALRSDRDRVLAMLDWTLLANAGSLERLITGAATR